MNLRRGGEICLVLKTLVTQNSSGFVLGMGHWEDLMWQLVGIAGYFLREMPSFHYSQQLVACYPSSENIHYCPPFSSPVGRGLRHQDQAPLAAAGVEAEGAEGVSHPTWTSVVCGGCYKEPRLSPGTASLLGPYCRGSHALLMEPGLFTWADAPFMIWVYN